MTDTLPPTTPTVKGSKPQPGLKPGSLSFTYDTHNHRIDRYPGDVLKVSHVTGRPVTQDEIDTVTRWYWLHVGQKGNDPK